MQFGGYITPRGPTGGVQHGTVGLLKQAIAMVGSGAKGLDWFEFGPEEFFPGAYAVHLASKQRPQAFKVGRTLV